jgi:glycosyltransferase involved in cell wall biosynthesis
MASFDCTLPHWQSFNQRAANAILQRAQPRDFICLIGGAANKAIADALPNLIAVEFGIGYPGTFAKFRVFESYAWMHAIYGQQYGAGQADGQWFDAVIPGYFERERFPFSEKKADYCCFVGRLIERKGYGIAVEVCKALGMKLLIAGQGTPPDYGEYLGVIGPAERGELMTNARACFVPTIYIEPFGNVAVEAMSCGTPVISTDWGAMTETVIHGKTGFRCRTFKQFLDAVEAAPTLDPHAIRAHAVSNYSLEATAPKYDAYFRRLSTLWDGGWYSR